MNRLFVCLLGLNLLNYKQVFFFGLHNVKSQKKLLLEGIKAKELIGYVTFIYLFINVIYILLMLFIY